MTNSKKQQLRRTVAGILCVAALAANAVQPLASNIMTTPFSVSAVSIDEASATTIDISNYEISDQKITVNITQSGTYVLKGSNYINEAYVDTSIVVAEGVEANLILDDFHICNTAGVNHECSSIDTPAGAYDYVSAFVINGTANIYVKSSSSIENKYGVPFAVNGTLNIKETDTNADLTLTAGYDGSNAYIAAGNGKLNIEGGKIIINSNHWSGFSIGCSTVITGGNISSSVQLYISAKVIIDGGTVNFDSYYSTIKNSLGQEVSKKTFNGLPVSSVVSQINCFTQKGLSTDESGNLTVWVPNDVNSIVIDGTSYEYAAGSYENPTIKPYEELKYTISIDGNPEEVTLGAILDDGYIYVNDFGTVFYPGDTIKCNLTGYAAFKDGDTWTCTVSNAYELRAFGSLVNSNSSFQNLNCVLTADVDLENIEWTPIDYYYGTFNGNGHTISNLKISSTSAWVGFINNLNDSGIVENLGIINANVSSSYNNFFTPAVGVIVGSNNGTVSNCFTSGTINLTSAKDTFNKGCLVVTNNNVLENCYTTGDVMCKANNEPINCYASVSDADLTSGALAYKLGDSWGQNLSTDTKPMIGGKSIIKDINGNYYNDKALIYGESVTLGGTIGVNVFVAATDDFEWTAKFDGETLATPEKNADRLYKFTYNVPAKDMDKEIEFSLNNETKTISVSQYLDELNGTTTDENTKNIITATKAYGNFANKYFTKKDADTQDVEALNTAFGEADLSGYAYAKSGTVEGISYYGSSLLLKSQTTVRHYFKLADGQNISNFTFSVGGENLTPVLKDGYYYIDIENIGADELGTAHAVKVNDTEVISNYSALSYAKAVLGNNSADESLVNLVKSLYVYSKSAESYGN